MSRIKILSSSLTELDTIYDVTSSSKAEEINGENTLDFSVPVGSSNTSLFVDGNIAEVDSDYFDIVAFRKGQNSNGELAANVECEHVSYRLNDPNYDMEYFTFTGTPTAGLAQLLAGTGFTVGTVEFTAAVTYSAQEKKSRRQLLMEYVDTLGGELYFNKFTISILAHRGSTTPKDLLIDRNIEVVGISYSKRDKDSAGNPLVSYECNLIRPMTIALGDVVSMDYGSLGISVQHRVVSITIDPYNSDNKSFQIGNFVPGLAEDAYRIETSILYKGKTYYGARISAENGFESIRSDKKARGVFNADKFALQVGDGTGINWTDKLYFDPASGKYVFDGTLSATMIEALKAVFDVMISNTVIVNNLYSEYGRIAYLTVSELDTSWKKISNYLIGSTADVNYVREYEQRKEFINAKTDGTQTIQQTDKTGAPLYWIDATHKGMTTNNTGDTLKVLTYIYTEIIKKVETFEIMDGVYTPLTIWGAGDGVTEKSGKTYEYKKSDGHYLDYYKRTSGELVRVCLTDDGVNLPSQIVYQGNTVISGGLPQIWVQADPPANAKANDILFDTDDYSRYDKTALTANTTLSISANEFITASGTITITLHSALSPGIIKKIYNVGVGIITIAGTINGLTNMYLYPGESVELITDGIGWRY